MSDHLPPGLYKGKSFNTGIDTFFYNEGGYEYGWYEWAEYFHWPKEDGDVELSTGWEVPAIVRWIDLTPSNELEFLVLTGKEFKKPNGRS